MGADEVLQDLCMAALQFANDTLKNGGHFVCKFYQGSEDKALEMKLKTLFAKVFREKPDSSRSVCWTCLLGCATRLTHVRIRKRRTLWLLGGKVK